MSTNLDMTQYLDLFLQETEEQLAILEQETLKLEQDPAPERLQIIFRAAHTLKGSSRAMGFSHLAEVTHEMENVLDALRGGTLSVTTEIADALLGCMDTLSAMHESIAAGNGDAIACENEVQRLRSLSGSPVIPEAKTATGTFNSRHSADKASLLKEARSQAEVLHARFRLHPECMMKFVRAFMSISALQEEGELLICIPDRDELEEEQFDLEFELFAHNNQPLEQLREKIGQISEIEWFEIGPWQPTPDEPASPTPVATMPTPNMTIDPAKPADAGAKKSEAGQTVRVDVARLDSLMSLVGELVIDRTRIAQIGADLAAKHTDPNVEALAETVGHIARITSDLQDQIMKARMMPIDTVFNRFPRVVRDLAQKLEKEVKLEFIGSDTELDRSVIEVIGDPLLHILRNSVDHGLESPEDREILGKPRQGRILVSAKHQDNHIVIEVVDDGKGIDADRIRAKAVESGLTTAEAAARLTDREALQFIFASGFSTAAEVSEVSGRGVGMDIVRSNIQRLGGLIDIETTLGEGTRFSLRLPLTLAIIRGLLVRISGVVYAIPLGSVVETLRIEENEIQTVSGREVILVRGLTTPLVRMRNLFATRNFTPATDSGVQYVVIVGLAEKRVGLVVDHLIGEQEVVLKSLSRFCGDVRGVSGATILGNGHVALIVDVNGVLTT
ncbi:MAG: chemotaxis protein CheA [Fimbriimonadaceae bacterium]|nr:chemotaxis protein CheA [Fimbriimonadaceae bacterium]